MTKTIFFSIVFLITIDTAGQAPNLKAVYPYYGQATMRLEWDPNILASEYQVRVKVNSGTYGAWINVGNVTAWDHTPINNTDTYTYQVRALVVLTWSPPSNERSNKMIKIWPVSNSETDCSTPSVNILNGFNQPIFVNSPSGPLHYLHEGLDIHGEEGIASECVIAPMGGKIKAFGGMGNGIFVNMEVDINGQIQYIQFNHLDNLNTGIMEGEQSVQPGDSLGVIYKSPPSDWGIKNSHTHCHFWTDYFNFFNTTKDPHLIWDTNAYRDPQNKTPEVGDTNGDMEELRFRKGPNQPTYFTKDTVYREADIVVEAYDPQSVDPPWAAPKLIGYYIQKFDGKNWSDAVKSSGTPYLLTDNAQGFYQSHSGTGGQLPHINNAISDRAAALTSGPPVTPSFYVFSQWWTYIVTNTSGTNGMMGNLNVNECWATDARDTAMMDNGYSPAYARARIIDEAKFPDGKYRAHIRLADYVNTAPDYKRIVFVDNFRPYVQRVDVKGDKLGQVNYSGNWTWDPGAGQLAYSSTGNGQTVCGEGAIITIFTSEAMTGVDIEIPSLSFTKASTTAKDATGKEWEFTVPHSVIENAGNTGPHKIHIDGTDLNGNHIQGFTSTNNVAAASIPTRQNDGTWLPAGATIKDQVHEFQTESSPLAAVIYLDITQDISVDSVSCNGASDGEMKVVAAGGTLPYQYSLDGGPFQDSDVFSNLSAKVYTITIKDANNNCATSITHRIKEPPEIVISVSGSGSIPYCIQDGPPEITLVAGASGGTPPHTLSWPGGTLVVSSGGTFSVNVTDNNGCMKNANTNVSFVPILCSRDPNDITGPDGYSDARWVSINDNLPYTIRFENDPNFASAPAQKIVVEHEPDSSINLFSVRLGDFGFANQVFEIPANSTYYSERLDLVDSLGVLVDVTAGIDVTTEKVFWIFESIDPLTGLPPIDPLLGLLPINDTTTHVGEGFVDFTVMPKSTSFTGDSIRAQATIVFDSNPSIETNIWKNLIDAFPPSSTMDALPAQLVLQDSLLLTWSGSDDIGGVGLDYYDLYISDNGGAFNLLQERIDTTAYTFVGVAGHNYDFFTIATDYVSNRELKTMSEQTVYFSNCEQAIHFLSGTLISSGNYQADEILTAAGKILNPESVLFTAGMEIELLPGFQVDLGAVFEAIILGCPTGN